MQSVVTKRSEALGSNHKKQIFGWGSTMLSTLRRRTKDGSMCELNLHRRRYPVNYVQHRSSLRSITNQLEATEYQVNTYNTSRYDVAVFTLNRSFYPTTSSVSPVSLLIHQIQILWSQTTVRQKNMCTNILLQKQYHHALHSRSPRWTSGSPRMLLVLVREFESRRGEILNLFAKKKKKKDQLLRAPSVGKHNSTRVDEGGKKEELKSSREKNARHER